MPTPVRIPTWVYILVYRKGLQTMELIRLLRSIGREAIERGHFPVNPWVFYAAYMGEGEIASQEEALSRTLFLRCSHVWLYEPPNAEMDKATFNILTHNEGSFLRGGRRPLSQRVPVSYFQVESGGAIITQMSRNQVDELIGCHLANGLFR